MGVDRCELSDMPQGEDQRLSLGQAGLVHGRMVRACMVSGVAGIECLGTYAFRYADIKTTFNIYGAECRTR